MIDATVIASGSDVVIGLAIAIPVLIVGGGVAVATRLRGRGPKSRVPAGEEAVDTPTDIELERGAEASRVATLERPLEEPLPAPEPQPEPEPQPQRGPRCEASPWNSGTRGPYCAWRRRSRTRRERGCAAA